MVLDDIEITGAKMNLICGANVGLTSQVDAEPAPGHASGTIAPGQILSAHRFLAPGLSFSDGRGDTLVIDVEPNKSPAVAQRDVGIVFRLRLEERLNDHLRDAEVRLQRLAAVVVATVVFAHFGRRREIYSRYLIAGKTSHKRNVVRIAVRHPNSTHCIGNTDRAKQLHRPPIGDIHLRIRGRRWITFDQKTLHAVLA